MLTQFFYERWGDAPVHSIAASLFLNKSQVHHFDDIGYFHPPMTHCPQSRSKFHDNGKCLCEPEDVRTRMSCLLTLSRPTSTVSCACGNGGALSVAALLLRSKKHN